MSSSTTTDLILLKAINVFYKEFHALPTTASFAPGRVNLIGEHTDYNDGFVLPFALPYRTYIVGSISASTESTVLSILDNSCTNVDELLSASFEINHDGLVKGEIVLWANYIKGTIYQYWRNHELPEAGCALNCVIVSNVPIGSGLSSSAALEVAFATFLEQLYNITTVTKVQKALRCQQAEHTFADTPCGIMDQYISTMGRKGNLLLIDCRSTEYQLIPFGSSGGNDSTGDNRSGNGNNSKPCPVILITNSNVKHQLSGSEYPDRVRQCKEAVQCLQTKYPHVNALRDATMSMIDAVKDTMTPLVYARAKHCITEDIRTQSTVEALHNNNFELVGQYMTASHYSLQHDYEVSCVELDLLVQIALTVPGVYGSRMTGGGFGGCTVTLVDKDVVDQLKDVLSVNYYKQTLLKCSFYECEPCDGTNVIELTEDILTEALSTDFTNSSAAAIILDISNRHQKDDNDDLQVDDSVQVTYDPEDEDGVDDYVDDLDDVDDVDDDKYLGDSSDNQYWHELVAYAAPLIIIGISISISVMLYYRKGK